MTTPAPDTKTMYDAVAKQHKLPPYAALNEEFDLDSLDIAKRRVLKEVAKTVFERINGFRTVLETTLQPERLLEMQEGEFLTDADRVIVADLTRVLMRLDRAMLCAEVENTDEAYANYLRDAVATWPPLKPKLLPIVKRLEDGWRKPLSSKASPHYLG